MVAAFMYSDGGKKLSPSKSPAKKKVQATLALSPSKGTSSRTLTTVAGSSNGRQLDVYKC
jgi:hypothetical protein